MDRLKLWLVPVYAVVGFLVVMAILPKTAWILKVQAQVLSGTWHGEHGPDDDTEPGWLAPKHLGPESNDPSTDDDTKFLKLIDSCWHSTYDSPRASDDERYRRFQNFFAYCERKDEAAYWAQFVRIDSDDCQIPDNHLPNLVSKMPSRKRTRALVIRACDEGLKWQPENSFFALMRAAALIAQGDKEGGHKAFLAASRLTQFDDFMSLETDIQYRWCLRHFGYQGNQIKFWILSGAVYPHFAQIKSLVRHFTVTEHPDDCVAAMRIGGPLMEHSSSLIGILIGRAIVSSALIPGQHRGSARDVPDDQVMPLTEKLQKAVPDSGDLTRLAKDYLALKPPFTTPQDAEPLDEVGTLNLLESAGSLVFAILIPVALFATWARSRFERINSISPYLIWFLLLGTTFDPGEVGVVTPIFVLVALLAIPAAFERSRRVAEIVGLSFCVVAVVVAFGFKGYSLLLPAVMFPAVLAIERFAKRIPFLVTAIVFLIMLIVVTGLIVNVVGFFGLARTWAACLGFFVAALALIPVRQTFRWQPMAGIASIALILAYGFTITRQLEMDKSLGKAMAIWDHEANRIRTSRGIQ